MSSKAIQYLPFGPSIFAGVVELIGTQQNMRDEIRATIVCVAILATVASQWISAKYAVYEIKKDKKE